MKLKQLLMALTAVVPGLGVFAVQAGTTTIAETMTVTATRDDQSLQGLAG